MDPRIALATRDDLPALVAIANDAAARTPANFATEPEPLDDWRRAWMNTSATHPWLVAHLGSRVVGFAKASPHRSRGAYAWTAEVTIYLHPDVHGRRLGHALYSVLLPALKAQGYVTLLAGIALPNPASERLHESFGFVRCATFHRVGHKLGRWHDVGYWELALQGEGAEPGVIRPVAEVLG